MEPEDFRIDSSGWRPVRLRQWPSGTCDREVLVNPEGDVWEALLSDGVTAQFFTLSAALRETARAGKRLPSRKEWETAVTEADPSVRPEFEWSGNGEAIEALGIALS